MVDLNDKRHRAALFRDRLGLAMADKDMSQSRLARQVGVDRSTISQLLAGGSTRLPNAQVVAECAKALSVSADWLLGLTNRPESGAELLAASVSVTEAPRALVDAQIFNWHQEAAGYKIRHVPATLPDMLKTADLLRWEYDPHLGKSSDQAIGASADRLEWMLDSKSDYEIALPLHELASFAAASGYYEGLPLDMRRAQLDHLISLTQQLYPTLRLYLFDARRVFSSPVTIFGPLLAVIYLGRHYLAFRDTARVSSLTQHFDWLVREASIGARDVTTYLGRLRADLG